MYVIWNVAEIQRNRFHLIAEYWMTYPRFLTPPGSSPREQPPAWAEAWLLASMWFCNDLCSVGCLRNQQINSHCWYYTPQWQRPFIILLMVTLFVHNQERLQGKQRRVEMWMEMLSRNTMSGSVPSTHTRMEKVPSFKAIWKHGCTVVFWMKSALRTIYAGSIVD